MQARDFRERMGEKHGDRKIGGDFCLAFGFKRHGYSDKKGSDLDAVTGRIGCTLFANGCIFCAGASSGRYIASPCRGWQGWICGCHRFTCAGGDGGRSYRNYDFPCKPIPAVGRGDSLPGISQNQRGKQAALSSLFDGSFCCAKGDVFLGIKRENAYFTVEAAILFPFIIDVMIFGMALFLFQYDRCLLNQDANRIVIVGSGIRTEEKQVLGAGAVETKKLLSQEKFAAWNANELEITLEMSEIQVEGNGDSKMPGHEWEATFSVSGEIVDPVFLIRQSKKIGGE